MYNNFAIALMLILTWHRCVHEPDWSRAIPKPSKILNTKRGLRYTEIDVGDNPTSNFNTSFFCKIGKLKTVMLEKEYSIQKMSKRRILDGFAPLMHSGHAFMYYSHKPI